MNSNGKFHGNIKPSNILITNNIEKENNEDEDDIYYVLTDYYLNDIYVNNNINNSNLRLSKDFIYMSPEMLKGKVYDKSCDIWSFGCILYYIYTGKTLFSGKNCKDVLLDIYDKMEDKTENIKIDDDDDLSELLRSVICVDKVDRLSIEEVIYEIVSINILYYIIIEIFYGTEGEEVIYEENVESEEEI